MPREEIPGSGTKALAIASHVTYGYVGNSMVVPIMQYLGCNVSALNTINLSNHKAYRQTKGKAVTADEIRDLYEGLTQSYLDDFDILLSGYVPDAAALEAVGAIARDLKLKSATKPGSFFWVLDPVMGDNGRLYVNEDVVPVYKRLLHDADLIVPNQFELGLLSDINIDNLESVASAITQLHQEYRIPHIVVTSISFEDNAAKINVIGSTQKSDGSPRLFHVQLPSIDAFFSGAGDMFAALVSLRLRDGARNEGLADKKSWISPDDIESSDLPLAKAVEITLDSMQEILQRTKEERDKELEAIKNILEQEEGSEKRQLLRKMKASEIRLIPNLDLLKSPTRVFKVEKMQV